MEPQIINPGQVHYTRFHNSLSNNKDDKSNCHLKEDLSYLKAAGVTVKSRTISNKLLHFALFIATETLLKRSMSVPNKILKYMGQVKPKTNI